MNVILRLPVLADLCRGVWFTIFDFGFVFGSV